MLLYTRYLLYTCMLFCCCISLKAQVINSTPPNNSRIVKPAITTSTDCTNELFIKRYETDQGQVNINDVIFTADGDMIGVGNFGYREDPDKEGGFILFRIRQDGTILWSKPLPLPWEQTPHQVLALKDGNFLAAGVTGSGGSYIKFDIDGNILWVKGYELGSVFESLNSFVAAEGQNGEVVVLAHYRERGLSFLDRVHYLKLDAAGNVMLARSFKYGISLLSAMDIYIEGDYSYIVGYYYLDNPPNNLPANVYGFLMKVDNRTAAIDWTKLYNFNNAGLSFVSIMKYTDNSFVLLGKNKVGHSDTAVLMVTDLNGNVSTASHFTYENGSRYLDHYALDGKGNVILGNHKNNSEDKLMLASIHPVNGVNWSRQYNVGIELYLEAIHVSAVGIFVAGNGFDVIDYHLNDFYYGRFSQNGLSACPAAILPSSFGPGQFTELSTPFIAEQKDVFPHPLQPPTRTIGALIALPPLCSAPVTCTAVTLSGPAKVCGSATLTYKATTNASCILPASFEYDTAYFHQLTVTDTEVQLSPKKSGTTTIKALVLVGCDTLLDQVDVVINKETNVNLGSDHVLCEGRSILLDAGPAYSSYRWQDGSAKQQLNVMAPGTYWVAVKNSCGETLTDTIRISAAPLLGLDAGPDRIKCNTDTVQLHAKAGFSSYAWSASDARTSGTTATLVANPLVATSYYVAAVNTHNCLEYDTVRVTVYHAPAIQLGKDTSFCAGNQVQLNAGSGFATYLWNTGAATPSLSVNAPGLYSVIGTTAQGCQAFDTLQVVTVFTNPVIQLEKDIQLCTGTSQPLDPGAFAHYLWQDGSTNRVFQASTVDKYYVQVTDGNGCTGSDTTRVTALLPPPAAFLAADTTICSYAAVELKPLKSYHQYRWSTGQSTPTITTRQAGWYWLEVQDENHCIGRDSLMVRLKECKQGLYVPTAFTPNTDNNNDLFKAQLFGTVKTMELVVYNRWGQVVFKTTDRSKGWDGWFQGKLQDSGVFVWVCTYQLEGQEKRIEKGTVTLIK